MVLFLQIGDQGSVFGLVGGQAAEWMEFSADRNPFPGLSVILERFGEERPLAVVCGQLAGDNPDFRASWSMGRTAVALANGLAFAWGVPVAALETSGREDRKGLAESIRSAALAAKPGEWIRAAYGGEPNITEPREKS
ncbi:hypothetical protein JW899_04485 [Candidatus Uhrbacteria bacterium]|nr:hypothetical protein [Candidatus Uhrbacteria bacterium]